jgi:hypothetical protein
LDLNDVEVTKRPEDVSDTIDLGNGISMKLRQIPVNELDNVSDKPEDFLDMIGLCIDTIADAENVWTRDQMNKDELNEFVSDLTHAHLQKIEQFIATTPHVAYHASVTCVKCQNKIEINLNGLNDFFQ